MGYRIVFELLKLLSRLPFWCLHRISDLLFLVLYYLIGYRRNVILNNLAIAFPANSIKENKKIARKFVRHFADIVVESVKTLTISEKELQKRYIYINQHLVQDEINTGRSIMMVAGHFANWEWLFYYANITGVLTWAAYKPMSNPIFDKLMVVNRERFGFKVIPSEKSADSLAQFNSENTQNVNCLMADQTPHEDYKYRALFLGKDVPFFIGPESYAKKYDLPIFYGSIKKVGRSKYTVKVIPITLHPHETKLGWITDEYIRLIEEDIRDVPEHYLWSHRRFKHAANTVT